jgi:hypothetical protein
MQNPTIGLPVAFLALALAAPALAQDMPLSQIIKEGEHWKPATLTLPATSPTLRSKAGFQYAPGPDHASLVVTASSSGSSNSQKLPLKHVGPMIFWPDEGTLVVADNGGRHLWAFRVEKDGTLTCGDRYYPLRVAEVRERSGRSPQPQPDDVMETTALLIDSASRLYAATEIGIQIFDPIGRLCGVIANPAKGKVSALAFVGQDKDQLAAVVDGKIYVRVMLARGNGANQSPRKK